MLKTHSKARVSAAHSPVEDIAALVTAAAVISLGLFLLKSAGAATGGTEGIALLLTNTLGVDLGLAIFLLAIPFYGLGLWQKGWRFALRSAVAVTLISAMSTVSGLALGAVDVNPVYGALVGNALLGIGFLILFRHDASPAGFSIVSLIAQDKLGWRAGHVQLAFDTLIVTSALVFAPPSTVLLSACGVAMLSLVLILNHRPGRYLAT
ncbi:YitT family protein [Tessaracoccus sp.]|uniref:YitT family protein n=1 Tax=Tessaracoccus sp. TaxID=1971211 RepID=UPI0026230B94|nr:YitT family protein [Tessaracoccus sp.]